MSSLDRTSASPGLEMCDRHRKNADCQFSCMICQPIFADMNQHIVKVTMICDSQLVNRFCISGYISGVFFFALIGVQSSTGQKRHMQATYHECIRIFNCSTVGRDPRAQAAKLIQQNCKCQSTHIYLQTSFIINENEMKTGIIFHECKEIENHGTIFETFNRKHQENLSNKKCEIENKK